MKKSILFRYICCGCLVLVIIIFLIIDSSHDDGVLAVLGLFFAILFFASMYFSYIFKIKEAISDPLASQSVDNIPIIDTMATNNTQVIIPDTCPHCKNPNTKRIRLCEWCGNQII